MTQHTRAWKFGILAILAGFTLGMAGCFPDKPGNQQVSQQGVNANTPPPDPILEKRKQELATFHDSCVEVFSKQVGFGVSRMPRPSHFQGPFPVLASLTYSQGGEEAPKEPWKVEKMELIGQVDGITPQAYTLPTTPFGKPPTRPLDAIENAMVTTLKEGGSLQTQIGPDQIRMVGPIRARGACVTCHKVQENTLLGAFTYILVPSKP